MAWNTKKEIQNDKNNVIENYMLSYLIYCGRLPGKKQNKIHMLKQRQ